MSEGKSGDTFARFIGILLTVVSVLWMAFCGLCALSLAGSTLTNVNSADGGLALLVLVVSGVAAAAGYAVFVVGRNLWRNN